MKWILLVGDNPKATAFRKLLRTEGFYVTAAATIALGEKINRSRFHQAIVFIEASMTDVTTWFDAMQNKSGSKSGCHERDGIYIVCGDEAIESQHDLPLFHYPTNTTPNLLLGHLRALLRRREGYECHYRVGPLGLDPVVSSASLLGKPLTLKPMEFSLLLCLLQAPEHFVPHTELCRRLWSHGSISTERRLRTLVCSLRRRLQQKTRQLDIVNVYRNGYRLTCRDEDRNKQ